MGESVTQLNYVLVVLCDMHLLFVMKCKAVNHKTSLMEIAEE